MDKVTLDRIKLAHPHLREQLLEQYLEINNKLPKGVRLRFSYVFRTPEEQHALFLKRPKVTKADSWQSIHNYGLAFDIVLLHDKNGDGTFELASWEQDKHWIRVVDFFKSKGWEHGGSWKNFKDQPHFQLKRKDGSSYKWQELKKRIDEGKSILDSGLTYPLI